MESAPERALVELAVLPEVFHGVLRAKALLADGTATSAARCDSTPRRKACRR